jgi:hypothetical protein
LPLHLLQGRHRSSSGVEVIRKPIDRDDPVRAQEQDRERRTLLGAPEPNLTALAHHLERPQDAELEHSSGTVLLRYRFGTGRLDDRGNHERRKRCTS